ncbi:unnamed protein product [Polarella glacialis]|uniref:Uncharacterized protein n=1 Tax=Polarella glacialis TaxID=89957 RepID=A0A813I025_POLGL|nr:unnamed protein product [Polarella glacialis]
MLATIKVEYKDTGFELFFDLEETADQLNFLYKVQGIQLSHGGNDKNDRLPCLVRLKMALSTAYEERVNPKVSGTPGTTPPSPQQGPKMKMQLSEIRKSPSNAEICELTEPKVMRQNIFARFGFRSWNRSLTKQGGQRAEEYQSAEQRRVSLQVAASRSKLSADGVSARPRVASFSLDGVGADASQTKGADSSQAINEGSAQSSSQASPKPFFPALVPGCIG